MKKLIVKAYNRWKVRRERARLKKEIQPIEAKLTASYGRKRLILFQTPSHTNIGDHAITQASLEFVARFLPDLELIEINQYYHFALLPRLGRLLSQEDVLLLHGGGNFGNQYMHEEYIRRSVIKAFPKNKIVMFPQTVFYSADPAGARELEKTQDCFLAADRLTLAARETVSYGLMQEHFAQAKTILVPDIVMTMNKVNAAIPRKGVLLVLRNDEERVLTDQERRALDEFAQSISDQVNHSDMHYHKHVRTAEERQVMLAYKFQQFQSAELVFTDRLHGMILAAITGTPCIAFSNYNQKVSGTYRWLEDLPYIRYVDGKSDWKSIAKELLKQENVRSFDTERHQQHFNALIQAIDD